jgi:hypothetical protein
MSNFTFDHTKGMPISVLRIHRQDAKSMPDLSFSGKQNNKPANRQLTNQRILSSS